VPIKKNETIHSYCGVKGKGASELPSQQNRKLRHATVGGVFSVTTRVEGLTGGEPCSVFNFGGGKQSSSSSG